MKLLGFGIVVPEQKYAYKDVDEQFQKLKEKEKNTRLGVFEIYKDSNNEFRFNLKASNGEIILHSEAYTSKTACKNGINAVKKYSKIASVEELLG